MKLTKQQSETKVYELTESLLHLKKDQKDVWVTMGFVVELANIFFEREISIKYKDDDKKQRELFSLYNINIDDVKIGGHPNLISTDGNVLLIPNADAPKFNIGFIYFN